MIDVKKRDREGKRRGVVMKDILIKVVTEKEVEKEGVIEKTGRDLHTGIQENQVMMTPVINGILENQKRIRRMIKET